MITALEGVLLRLAYYRRQLMTQDFNDADLAQKYEDSRERMRKCREFYLIPCLQIEKKWPQLSKSVD